MQEQFLYFLQSYSNPLLDQLFVILTMFGEDFVIITILTWIYWNTDKKKGFVLTFTLIISILSNNILKVIFRSPRPYQVLNNLDGKRINTATGYSFPSGHTQNSTTLYSSLCLIFKNKILIILSIILITSIAFSRIYLAVHWPIDVIASLLLGLIIPRLTIPFLHSIHDDKKKNATFILFFNLAAVLILLLIQLSKIFLFNSVLLTDDLIKSTALLNGVSWGFLLDFKGSEFQIENTMLKKILRFVMGLFIAFLIMEGLKVLLPYTGLFHYIRYFITGLWIIYIYPYIGHKLSLFRTSDRKELL